jgi:hypothetical protein
VLGVGTRSGVAVSGSFPFVDPNVLRFLLLAVAVVLSYRKPTGRTQYRARYALYMNGYIHIPLSAKMYGTGAGALQKYSLKYCFGVCGNFDPQGR